MKAIFLDRNRVITEATTDYAIVILDGVDEFVEPVRNPNLVDQLNAVKGWGKPVLLRIVANAQWYCDSVNGIDKTDSWKYWLNKWLEDDTSAMVGLAKANLTPVDGLIITAWKDEAKGTTSAWVKMTMIEAMDMAKDWGLPTWAEFPLHIDQTWDKAQLVTYCNNLKEYAVRPVEKTPTTSYEIIMPDNSLSYLPSITQPDIPVDEPEDDSLPYDDEYDNAILPEILAELKKVNIGLDSIQKLIEAQAPWRKQ